MPIFPLFGTFFGPTPVFFSKHLFLGSLEFRFHLRPQVTLGELAVDVIAGEVAGARSPATTGEAVG